MTPGFSWVRGSDIFLVRQLMNRKERKERNMAPVPPCRKKEAGEKLPGLVKLTRERNAPEAGAGSAGLKPAQTGTWRTRKNRVAMTELGTTAEGLLW